jgi:phosphoribosylamine---glycine ligase
LKILVVGGGGREHALAWRLSQSPSVSQIVASPGNPGIAKIAKCVPAPPTMAGYADLAEAEGIDLTVVGPEAPLVAGIVDQFRSRGHRIVGPTQAAAKLEGSKIFAKQFFERAHIPTARSIQTSSVDEALEALREFALPVVIKADGLAAGKGVVIANSKTEAQDAVRKLGPALVLEEFLSGEEVSFIGLSTGETVLPFPPSQDHKRAFDGDKGPNTGGMGAYLDTGILTPGQTGEVMERIMLPAIRQMRSEGTPFTGFLYAGLMMTGDGPKILEFNVRLGDPETQTLMHSFQGDLAQFLMGDASAAPSGHENPSVCVVIAAAGYPDAPETGSRITGTDAAEQTGAVVFQAGTKLSGNDLIVSGGRVLGVTAGGATLPEAIEAAYRAVREVRFDGMQHRTDIGQKGLRRW